MKFAQRFWAAKVSVFAEDIRRNDKGTSLHSQGRPESV